MNLVDIKHVNVQCLSSSKPQGHRHVILWEMDCHGENCNCSSSSTVWICKKKKNPHIRDVTTDTAIDISLHAQVTQHRLIPLQPISWTVWSLAKWRLVMKGLLIAWLSDRSYFKRTASIICSNSISHTLTQKINFKNTVFNSSLKKWVHFKCKILISLTSFVWPDRWEQVYLNSNKTKMYNFAVWSTGNEERKKSRPLHLINYDLTLIWQE